MIFLIAAAALCMGGIVAYLAREKGRSPLTWAIYGMVAAPIALPHILLVQPLHDADVDVWAEIRDAIQTQSVNDQRPILSRSGNRREMPLRQTPAPSINADPRREPKADMVADKRNSATPSQRAEPSFGSPAAAPAPRAAANEFMLNASDRIGAAHPTHSAAAPTGDMRTRAPLSIDPNAERAESRPITGRLFAAGAVAVAVAAGFFVLGPTVAKLIPPELAFWTKPAVTEVKNTSAPTGITPSGSAAPSAAPGATANEALPGGNVSGAKDVGEAKFGGPIKSDTKAPAYQGSGAAPVDLGMATRGMKPVDVPEETKSEPKAAAPAPKADAPKAKSETKSAAVTPAPAPAPKAEPKAVAATPAPTPAPKVETPKAAAPAAAPVAPKPAAPPEDFLSMVNKAITPGSTSGSANSARTAPPPQQTATRGDEQGEQVSAANDLVQSVQVKLREKGFDPGSIDGRTNPKTVQAVRDYQQSVGMTPDGLIDVALMERLGVVGKRLQFPGGR